MEAASRPRLLSVEQVAERLGVAPRYVRRLAAERRIRFFKVGHLLRFAEDDLDAWIGRICAEAIDGRFVEREPSAHDQPRRRMPTDRAGLCRQKI